MIDENFSCQRQKCVLVCQSMKTCMTAVGVTGLNPNNLLHWYAWYFVCGISFGHNLLSTKWKLIRLT